MLKSEARIKAAKVRLGIRSETWTSSQVRSAYAAKMTAAHPDHGGTGADIPKLKAARDLLARHATEQNGTPCPHCGGTGYVQD
jgi:hypothetical protein